MEGVALEGLGEGFGGWLRVELVAAGGLLGGIDVAQAEGVRLVWSGQVGLYGVDALFFFVDVPATEAKDLVEVEFEVEEVRDGFEGSNGGTVVFAHEQA